MLLAPSRRLIAFVAAILLLLALPVAIAAFAVLRAALTPPVPHTRLFAFDGLQLHGNCYDSPAAKGGRALVCSGYWHVDSRWEILNHDSGAVAWCVQREDDWHFNQEPPKAFGPLAVGRYPPVPPDWGLCGQMLPVQIGLYGQVIILH
jgi:hypothetical protein